MVIAVNTKITGNDEPESSDNFIFETFSQIVPLHPEHTFVLISETPLTGLFIHFENVINVPIGQQTKNPALWYLWYNIKIPTVLKKYKADIFVSYGIGSNATKIPQCLIIPGLTFTYQPFIYKKSNLLFYKTFVARSIKKSKVVITVSEFCKSEIIKQYKTDINKIQVVYRGINENFIEIGYEEKKEIKIKYADGNEYFIYLGEIGSNKNLLNLLKAFSAFKKRQKSNMQLLIAGKQGWKYEEFAESLRLFRFKEEVKILKDISQDDIAIITASAYAMVYPSLYENFATQPLLAMKCGVPVITSLVSALPEICGDAALYADTENFKEIAVKMMSLFRDENLRKQVIEKGKVQAQKFNWNITSDLLWKNIDKIIK